jgi:hypothetical protein
MSPKRKHRSKQKKEKKINVDSAMCDESTQAEGVN